MIYLWRFKTPILIKIYSLCVFGFLFDFSWCFLHILHLFYMNLLVDSYKDI